MTLPSARRRGIRLKESLEGPVLTNSSRDYDAPNCNEGCEACPENPERLAQQQVDNVAHKLSWKLAAAVSGIFLVIATTWVTTVSTVTWQLTRNCDVVLSRLSALDDVSESNSSAIQALQTSFAALPSRESLDSVIAAASTVESYVTGDREQMNKLKEDERFLREGLSQLRADVLIHKQIDIKMQGPVVPVQPSYGPYQYR